MKSVLLISTIISLVSGLPSRADEPTLQATQVGNVTYIGAGCPSNSTTSSFSNDTWTLNYDGFTAIVEANITAGTSDCITTLSVAVPSGWKLTPDKIRDDFFTWVQEGVDGVVLTEASFSVNTSHKVTHLLLYIITAKSLQSNDTLAFAGPATGSGWCTADFGSKPFYSPCGGGRVDISLHTRATLKAINSTDLQAEQSLLDIKSSAYTVKWVRC